MPKVVIRRSETDLVVERWLAGKAFTLNDVMAYTIERSAGDIGVITLKMHFDDKPAEAGGE